MFLNTSPVSDVVFSLIRVIIYLLNFIFSIPVVESTLKQPTFSLYSSMYYCIMLKYILEVFPLDTANFWSTNFTFQRQILKQLALLFNPLHLSQLQLYLQVAYSQTDKVNKVDKVDKQVNISLLQILYIGQQVKRNCGNVTEMSNTGGQLKVYLFTVKCHISHTSHF